MDPESECHSLSAINQERVFPVIADFETSPFEDPFLLAVNAFPGGSRDWEEDLQERVLGTPYLSVEREGGTEFGTAVRMGEHLAGSQERIWKYLVT